MTSIADGSVCIQTSSVSVPAPPSWLGELVLLTTHLRKHGMFEKITKQVRFTRKRFGRYEVIDFLAVLLGYAISGERTLEAFYQSLQPVAGPFMALFDRNQLPSRSALSRFLAALTAEPVEALRALFLDDLTSRPLTPDNQTGGLTDRTGHTWIVFDIDGRREAARQRALPKGEDLPPPFRRLDEVCASGYTGRKRGQVVRTRTTVSQAHSSHWLGSFGNRGNGQYGIELRQGLATIRRYLTAYQLEPSQALVRLDGRYGLGAVIADVASFAFVTRGKEYSVLDHPLVQARLHLPPDQVQHRPESQTVRSLYDCPSIPVGPQGVSCRVSVATHPAEQNGKKNKKKTVGVRRAWSTNSSSPICPNTASPPAMSLNCTCIVGRLSRFSQMKTSSLIPTGGVAIRPGERRAWQVIAQWTWNLRLELGHLLTSEPVRTTDFASALSATKAGQEPEQGYEPPVVGGIWKAERYSGEDFVFQADGTVGCPAGKRLSPQERRREANGSLRIVYEARIADCRACQKRPQCQWHGQKNQHPRRVSVLLHPCKVGSAPLLWQDWPRRAQRRACMQLLRHQRVEVIEAPTAQSSPPAVPGVLSRARRAHYRLNWDERLARNACKPTAAPLTLILYGVPDSFAAFLGLKVG
jgi:hypothetical protein